MSVRISVQQLHEQLSELLDPAVEEGEECIIERDGKEFAVLIGAREWRQLHQGAARPSPRRTGRRSQVGSASDPEPLASSTAEGGSNQEQRLQAIGAKLDALGPKYCLAPEKQARAEKLLARDGDLNTAERRELRELLRESDEILLRRAEALSRIG